MTELLTDIDRIMEYRAALSDHISILLGRYGSTATPNDIKALIFGQDHTNRPSQWVADLVVIFKAPSEDIGSLLPVIQDAWNYFPHRSLGGRCPAETFAELARAPRPHRRSSRRRHDPSERASN